MITLFRRKYTLYSFEKVWGFPLLSFDRIGGNLSCHVLICCCTGVTIFFKLPNLPQS